MKLHEYFQILTVFGYSLGWLSSCPMVMCHIVLLIYLVYLGSRVIPIMSNYETPPYGLLFYQGGHHLVDLCGFWQAKFRHPTWAPHSAFFPYAVEWMRLNQSVFLRKENKWIHQRNVPISWFNHVFQSPRRLNRNQWSNQKQPFIILSEP